MPQTNPRWAAAGLHLHVTLPAGADERAVARIAEERGVLIEEAARHWAAPAHAPPSLVLGYGPLSEPAIRRGIGVLAGALRAG